MNTWIFDIDGIITDLKTKEVKYPQILQKIADKLSKSEPVGIITGRTASRITNAITDPIESLVPTKDFLDLLDMEGEFGGVNIRYEDGKRQVLSENKFFLPTELVKKGKEIIDGFDDIVFFDLKKTFFTAEMKNGENMRLFKDRQGEIAEKLQKLVDEFGLSDSLEVHKDTIAVNVKNKKLNKHLATKKFLEWLEAKQIKPDVFYVFGDSSSNLQIGEELHSKRRNLKFIYVGKDYPKDLPFEIIKPEKLYDEGTLEYLLSN